ncbi:MAG: arginine--tRNA ligase [Lentisphaerae bacterium]|jgi:arginyl-tRNA synthetase|nr:arginine--tRNA ligase [Lentisphaerota bacterium]
MKLTFANDLAHELKAKYNLDDLTVTPEICPPNFDGDLTVNCFVLAKQLKARNPIAVATEVKQFLDGHNDVVDAQVAKAFVNITLKPEALLRDTIQDEGQILAEAILPKQEQRHILIEFSAPNTNKPQHLGHVRNNTIGMATASILESAGHRVTRINLVNDRGIHICKSMIAYQRFGNNTTPEREGKKGDHLVGDFYVAYDKEYRKQLAELRKNNPDLADKSDDDLFLNTEIGRAAQDMLIAWENNDEDVRNLWTKMNQWVFDGFAETYRRMGVTFKHTYLESETYMLGKDIIQDGLERGVFKKREDGATVIDFDDPSLGSKVVLRSDGTSVYVTQDIGTTLLKQKDYNPDQQIWVVGDEQIRHFKVLFAILKALGYEWADNLTHMAYGMVNLPTGKMKSREGTVVDADDLIDEMEALAKQATLEKAGDTPPENLDERAQTIAMAALKFMLLKVNPKTTIMFDPQASIKFEGDTGPYVLYAYARIASMLRKAQDQEDETSPDWSALKDDAEKKLAIRCALYPEMLQKSARELDSSTLANYLLDLAKDFSTFYRICPVLNAEEPALKAARLHLSKCVKDILKHGLNALTINTLESM